jgi:hypothetical protein
VAHQHSPTQIPGGIGEDQKFLSAKTDGASTFADTNPGNGEDQKFLSASIGGASTFADTKPSERR